MTTCMKCKKCGKSKPMRDITIISATFPGMLYGAEGEMALQINLPLCRDCIRVLAEGAGYAIVEEDDHK